MNFVFILFITKKGPKVNKTNKNTIFASFVTEIGNINFIYKYVFLLKLAKNIYN